MILSAIVSIDKDGRLTYKGHPFMEDIQFGDSLELQMKVFTMAHKAIEAAINEVNDRLAKDGLAEKLANLEL